MQLCPAIMHQFDPKSDAEQSVLITLRVMPLPFAPVPSPVPLSPARRAFTLVELFVVITIIALLASVFMGAMYSAQETARTAKTKATIAKINALLIPKYE